MAFNIVEEICKKLGIPGLHKIDPNTQDVNQPGDITPENYLWQGAIPAVLVGLYKFSGDKTGNAFVINGETSNILPAIFKEGEPAAITHVAQYTKGTEADTREKMELAAENAVMTIRENLTDKTSDDAVRKLLIDQRNNILVYLPGELRLGGVLDDDTIDDQTNKMEGPVSSSLHWIQKIFPSTDRKKDENW